MSALLLSAHLSDLQILTGPNCSGKTTYLKQTALSAFFIGMRVALVLRHQFRTCFRPSVVIMAHLGCYVPATSVSTRLTDRICTHLSTGDDMEANASTFLKEMKEAAFTLAHAGKSYLRGLRVSQ